MRCQCLFNRKLQCPEYKYLIKTTSINGGDTPKAKGEVQGRCGGQADHEDFQSLHKGAVLAPVLETAILLGAQDPQGEDPPLLRQDLRRHQQSVIPGRRKRAPAPNPQHQIEEVLESMLYEAGSGSDRRDEAVQGCIWSQAQ